MKTLTSRIFLFLVLFVLGTGTTQLEAPLGNPAEIITELTSRLSFASLIPRPKKALTPYQIIPYILAYAPNNQVFIAQLNRFFFYDKKCVDLKNNDILDDVKVIAQLALYLRYDVLNRPQANLFLLDYFIPRPMLLPKNNTDTTSQQTESKNQNTATNTTLSRNATSYQSLADLASLNS